MKKDTKRVAFLDYLRVIAYQGLFRFVSSRLK